MKRGVVFVMFGLVAVLSAVAIFVGLRLRQPESTLPDYIFADGQNCCNEPDYQTCEAGDDVAWQNGYDQCVNGGCDACSGGGPECGNGQCENGENSSNCTADCPSGSSSGSSGGTECTGCGGSGESCCVPQNCGGYICDSGLACDNSSGTCTDSGACIETGTPSNNCMIYDCPNGCSDYGGGALECRQGGHQGDCGTQLSGCGQIDLLNTEGGFCQVISKTCSNSGCGPTGSSSSSSSSSSGDTCGNGTVNGNEECDMDADPTGCPNGEQCLADCTCAVEPVDEEITIAITTSTDCVCDDTTHTSHANVVYTITITNNGDDTTHEVQVSLPVPDFTFVTNISPSGSIEGGLADSPVLVWEGLNLPSGDTVITYQLTVGQAQYGNFITSVRVITEGDILLATASQTTEVDCLPCTALISDSVDRILIGVLLVLVGVFAIRFDLLNGAYNLFVKAGGKYFVANFDDDQRKTVTDEKAKRLEKRLLK